MVLGNDGTRHLTSDTDYTRCLACGGSTMVPDDFDASKTVPTATSDHEGTSYDLVVPNDPT